MAAQSSGIGVYGYTSSSESTGTLVALGIRKRLQGYHRKRRCEDSFKEHAGPKTRVPGTSHPRRLRSALASASGPPASFSRVIHGHSWEKIDVLRDL